MLSSNAIEALPNTVEQSIPLLEVKNLSVTFKQYHAGLRETNVQAISKLDLTIHPNEIVAVVGASGSGKSLLASAILGLLPKNASVQGSISFNGNPLTKKLQKSLRGKEILLIPQSVNTLDPLMKTGKQVQTLMEGSRKEKKQHQEQLFQQIGLPPHASNSYPHELSGGMIRRVLASTSFVRNAKLVIADEPTPGLDPESLQGTMRFIKQLSGKGKGVLFITHNIGTALQIAHKVAVFYCGQTIEIANAEKFTGKGEKLRHPYTRALWNALPENDFLPIPGTQPLPNEKISGCIFQERCKLAKERCKTQEPNLKEFHGEMVRCFYA